MCLSGPLKMALELKPTPLANEFLPAGHEGEHETFPLYLSQCSVCQHVQLPVVVDPERLFRNYVYVSGTSPAFVKHFERYADLAIQDCGLKPGNLVVDIGSNDGTLLKAFRDRGMRVLGIDPATKIAELATANGLETWPEFFTKDTAYRIKNRYGEARLVVANNVFAHADNLHQIAMGVGNLLHPEGHFIFEVSYFVDVVEQALFDTIYHEHLSYHTVWPLVNFFSSMDMTLTRVDHIESHGGSIRCFVRPGIHLAELSDILAIERACMANDPFGRLRAKIDDVGAKVRGFVEAAKANGEKVAGYGAPAKATTLSHQFGIKHEDLTYVVDDSPWKQGLLTPGTKIPVVSSAELETSPPDRLLLFAWNFADQIIAKNPSRRFVVPLPVYREVNP